MPNWKFKLLGDFAAIAPEGCHVLLPGRKHQAVLAFVLSSHQRRVTRDHIMELLWSTRSESQARASLRGVLTEIRKACRTHGGCPINADRTHVFVADPHVEVDVGAITAALSKPSHGVLERAAEMYTGPFLDSLTISNERSFEYWKETEQENVRLTYRRVLSSYLQMLLKAEISDPIESIANRILEFEKADEEAHRALMKMYSDEGRQSRAFEQFERCRRSLRERYDSDVSPETMLLMDSIRTSSHDPTHPTTRATDTTTIASPHQEGEDVEAEIALVTKPFIISESKIIDMDYGEILAEEIAGAASKFIWFDSRPCSETLRPNLRELSAVELSKAVGAKYVLGGRIRALPSGHALTVELIDGVNRRTVWRERFNLSDELLADTEEIAAQVVGQLDVKLRANEITEAYRLDRQARTGYECVLLALSNLYDLSGSSYAETEALFRRAVELKPDRSWHYSMWALWKMFCAGQEWAADQSEELIQAAAFARQAIKRNSQDALARAICGHFESFWEGNLEQGSELFNESLALNPYSSFAWMLSSATYSYRGEPQEAFRRLERSKTLCPVEPHFAFMFNSANCIAHLINRDPEQAAAWGLKIVNENPGFTNGYKQLLVALGHLGKADECDRYLTALRQLEPGFNAAKFLRRYPFARDCDREFFCEGLRAADVPIKVARSQINPP